MIESLLMYVTKDGIGMTFAWGVLGLMILGMAFIFLAFITETVWNFIQSILEYRHKKQQRMS